MFLFKYFCNVSSKEFDAAPASSSTNEVNSAERRKTKLKRPEWNDSYINCGFFRPIGGENFYQMLLVYFAQRFMAMLILFRQNL